VNVLDVRLTGNYDYTSMTRYLNRMDVVRALHVDPRALPYAIQSDAIANLFAIGEQDNYAPVIGLLINMWRIPMLIYNGVFDMDCNFEGTDSWLALTVGNGWSEISRVPWLDSSNVQVGMKKQLGNLTQLLVQGAGHMVPFGNKRF
jgi:carboxypeptidase C (cathepsin A)